MNTSPKCRSVLAWTAHGDRVTRLQFPPPDLVAHVAHCVHCQRHVLALVADIAHPRVITCETCEDDIAAYIDIEREDGRIAAVRAYPNVWFHLWNCPDCLELYTATMILLQAEAEGALPPFPLKSQPPRIQLRPPSLLVQRRVFSRIVVVHSGLGAAWGDDDNTVHEVDQDGYHINVHVKYEHGEWFAIVTILPYIVGYARVSIGDASFRAPFSPTGIASVGPIPAYLLTSSHGPDMAITIEDR